MNEAKKTFDPFILLFSAVYLIVLLLSLYTHMYYGEYSTRDLITENGKLKMENSYADTTCNPFSTFSFQLFN